MIIHRATPVLIAALFLMAGAAFGQDRSETHEVDAGGGDRWEASSEPAPPPEPEPAATSEPAPEPPEPSASSEPPADSSDSSEPRTAVPIAPDDHEGRPQRQPPTRHNHGHGGDGSESYYDGSSESAADDSGSAPYPAGGFPWLRFGRGLGDEMGALDLDISPGRTQVYLNGQRIGTADAFDGWPRYLSLSKGTYEIVFYLDGYKTLARRVTVYPGLVIDMNDRMVPGASIRPEDLPLRPHGQ